MSKEDKKIAVIGPTQSGKTCLAVGLFKTSTRGFTIETPDAKCCGDLNELARKFAISEWPDPTNLGTEENIRFDFCQNGKEPIRVAFLDFAGEKLGVRKQCDRQENSDVDNSDPEEQFKRFANANFKNLAGVVLLVNPGSKAFQSGDIALLADTMAQYKRIINYLRDPNSNNKDAFVALTITAADRLKGDLSGNLKTFEDSVEELSNSLRTGGFKWKKFEVSVTGQLKDQARPKLAEKGNNSASKPFLWILRELKWFTLREKIRKNICTASIITAALALGTIGWCLVDANNEKSEIDGYAQKCLNAVEACEGQSKPKEKDLEDARVALGNIQEYQGRWRKAYAAKLTEKLDEDVLRIHKRAIDRAISEIAEKPESEGSISNCSRVDDLFRKYQPLSDETKRAWGESCKEWEVRKSNYQEQYFIAQLLDGVRKPIEKSRDKHGKEFFSLAFGLYGKLAGMSSNKHGIIAIKERLSKVLDDRVAKEWRDYAIPEFNNKAGGVAAQEEVRDFVALLDSWQPATPEGEKSKAELLADVSGRVPMWRTQYETTKFTSEADKAIKKNSMEDMAMFYPGRVATNEFLTVEFAEKQWKSRVKPVFERELKAYLDGIVAKSSNGRNRPTFADDDKNDITRKASEVGAPFDEEGALKYVEERVASKSENWESEKREECNKWIREKIRPGRSRTDSKGLWSEYEKDPIRRTNPLFTEIVGPAVYREVEKWFESDVAAFKKELSPAEGVSLWLDDSNFEVRYQGLVNTFEEFKKTCRRINEDKNPPAGTWAHRFAELCITKGGIENGGVNKVFGQRIVAKQLDARIDYQKKFPVNYKCTAFAAWFEVESFEGNGTPMKGDDNLPNPQLISLIDADGENAPKNETTSISKEFDGEFKTIWSDEKILDAGLFQRTKFVVKATDYNGNLIKKTSDIAKVFSFVDKQRTLELDGQLHIGRFTGVKDADIKVRLSVDISGETPFSLLEQAKQEIRERGVAK